MAITRISSTVVGSNAISAEKLANGSLSARHFANSIIQLQHLGSSANTQSLETRINANLNVLDANADAIETRRASNVTSLTAADTALQVRIAANTLLAASNDLITYTRLNANLDILQDNIAGIIDGTVFTGEVTMNDDLIIQGNLTINGDQTVVDSTSLTVEDRMIMLNEGSTGSPSADVGILFNRGNQGNAAFFYDESAKSFTVADTQDPPSNTALSAVTLSNITVGILSATTVNYNGADLSTSITDNVAALQARIDANNTLTTAVEARRVTNVAVAASNDFITFTRLNANINVVNDNVASSTEMTPFTNVNSALGTSNVFFTGRDITSHANVISVSLDGVTQGNTEFVYHLSNDSIQFKDVSIPSGTVVTIFTLA
jgi:hypothetical protein